MDRKPKNVLEDLCTGYCGLTLNMVKSQLLIPQNMIIFETCYRHFPMLVKVGKGMINLP